MNLKTKKIVLSLSGIVSMFSAALIVYFVVFNHNTVANGSPHSHSSGGGVSAPHDSILGAKAPNSLIELNYGPDNAIAEQVFSKDIKFSSFDIKNETDNFASFSLITKISGSSEGSSLKLSDDPVQQYIGYLDLGFVPTSGDPNECNLECGVNFNVKNDSNFGGFFNVPNSDLSISKSGIKVTYTDCQKTVPYPPSGTSKDPENEDVSYDEYSYLYFLYSSTDNNHLFLAMGNNFIPQQCDNFYPLIYSSFDSSTNIYITSNSDDGDFKLG